MVEHSDIDSAINLVIIERIKLQNKHVVIKFCFMQDLVVQKEVSLEYYPSNKILSDLPFWLFESVAIKIAVILLGI